MPQAMVHILQGSQSKLCLVAGGMTSVCLHAPSSVPLTSSYNCCQGRVVRRALFAGATPIRLTSQLHQYKFNVLLPFIWTTLSVGGDTARLQPHLGLVIGCWLAHASSKQGTFAPCMQPNMCMLRIVSIRRQRRVRKTQHQMRKWLRSMSGASIHDAKP